MRLEAVRLVQWYHFQDELLPIGASCLLLGDNGSGKTTILDAIQVALVAHLSEVLLNRAANDKSRRAYTGTCDGRSVLKTSRDREPSSSAAVHARRTSCSNSCTTIHQLHSRAVSASKQRKPIRTLPSCSLSSLPSPPRSRSHCVAR